MYYKSEPTAKRPITETAHSNTKGQNESKKTHNTRRKNETKKQKNYINNTLKQMMIKLQNPHEIRKQLITIIII